MLQLFLLIDYRYLYMFFQPIRHEILNQPQNPCETDPEYNYAKCVEKSIITRAGCQPAWKRVNVEGLPLCDNFTTLRNFHLEYLTVWKMDRKMINDEIQCLIPCSFMEYKVGICHVSP